MQPSKLHRAFSIDLDKSRAFYRTGNKALYCHRNARCGEVIREEIALEARGVSGAKSVTRNHVL